MSISEDLYQELTTHRLLTRSEEADLIGNAQAGDRQATSRLIEFNQRLVARIARRYAASPMAGSQEFMDLVQMGDMGLLHAIKKFDISTGYKFSTYATYWIHSYIHRFCSRNLHAVSVSFQDAAKIISVKSRRNEFLKRNHREPTPDEIAKEVGSPIHEVNFYLTVPAALRLDDQSGDDDMDCSEVIIGDPGAEDTLEESLELEEVRRLLLKLGDRHRQALILRFGLDHKGERSTDEIATELKISRSEVYRIIAGALDQLRTMSVHPMLL